MSTVDDSFFNYFAASTLKTIKDLCQLPVTPGAPFVKGEREQEPFAIAGLIGLTSSIANGSIVLYFPKTVFLALMEKMLGEKMTEIKPETEDAAAELLNIIFGQAKTVLNKKGHSVQMAIPSVLRGSQVFSSYSKTHAVKVLPFKTEAGEFYIEFLLNKLDPAKQEQGPAKPMKPADTANAKAAFFKPFLEGTVKTMQVQCNIEAHPRKPFYRKSSSDYQFDIAGIIGITSKTVQGTFMMSFKREAFLKLVSKMFGEEVKEFQPGLEDAVTEIVNIILGSAKTVLNAEGHGLQMAIPTIVHGDSIFSSFQQQRSPGVVIPFDTEIGEFFVEINIE